jgi:hypothetical protein
MHQLSIADAEELACWFLPKMNQELRGRLMAERPQLYGRVFPGVRSRIILERVQSALEARPAPCPVQPGCYQEWPHYGPHTPDDIPCRNCGGGDQDGHKPWCGTAPGHYHDHLGTYDYCADRACPSR